MKMNIKIAPVLMIAVAALACSSVKTVKKSDFSPEKYKKLAVMDFDGSHIEESKALAECFIPFLMEAGFSVIERSGLEKLLKEQQLGMSGVLDNSRIAQIGRIAGVNALVLGSYRISDKKKRIPLLRRLRTRAQTGGRQAVKTESVFERISIRIVDVETGEILCSSTSEREMGQGEVDVFFRQTVRSFSGEK
jgi:curli biogenesis system outer membrane secretion channel CsgG